MHALSVRSLPGENLFASTVFKLSCLIVPYTGLRRGLCLISRASNLTRDDLQAAARANALCMVVRTGEWRPEGEEVIDCCTVEETPGIQTSGTMSESGLGVGPKEHGTGVKEFEMADSPTSSTDTAHALARRPSQDDCGTVTFQIKDPYQPLPARGIFDKLFRMFVQTYRFHHQTPSLGRRFDPDHVKVHGHCKLPVGYGLSYVPEDVKVSSRHGPRHAAAERSSITTALLDRDLGTFRENLNRTNEPETKVASNGSATRILFSLAQTISGGVSLYRAQGAQIDRYGYAAFGLTVLPYMVVSVFNFVGSLLTGDYDMVYLVHSSIMDEMVGRGGSVDGAVGTLESTEGDGTPSEPVTTSGLKKIEIDGTPVAFQRDGENVRFRQANTECEYSKNLSMSISPPAKPKPTAHVIHHETKLSKRLCQWLRRNRCKESTLPRRASTTTISIPLHGPFMRLPAPVYQSYLDTFTVVLLIIAIIIPYLIIYALSGFKENQSTSNQRTSTLNWLIFGQAMGYVVGSVEKLSGRMAAMRALLIVFVIYGSYSMCGFVVVAQEMVESGTCQTV